MKTSVVITTINKPNKVIRKISNFCRLKNWKLIIIGDQKSPKKFKINFGQFFFIIRPK